MPDDGSESPVRPMELAVDPARAALPIRPPGLGGEKRPNLDVWSPVYPRVTLTGTVRDQLEKEHDVDLELHDVPGLRARAIDAGLASLLRETREQRDLKTLAKSAEGSARR